MISCHIPVRQHEKDSVCILGETTETLPPLKSATPVACMVVGCQESSVRRIDVTKIIGTALQAFKNWISRIKSSIYDFVAADSSHELPYHRMLKLIGQSYYEGS